MAHKKPWEPEIFSRLFLDNKDHVGILFYYEDIIEESKEIEAEIRKANQNKK